jgi:hypothetical protein
MAVEADIMGMIEDARRELPMLSRNPQLLTLLNGLGSESFSLVMKTLLATIDVEMGKTSALQIQQSVLSEQLRSLEAKYEQMKMDMWDSLVERNIAAWKANEHPELKVCDIRTALPSAQTRAKNVQLSRMPSTPCSGACVGWMTLQKMRKIPKYRTYKKL